jgi:hypothetical protein
MTAATAPNSQREAKRAWAARNSAKEREIGPIPDIANLERRESCRDSLRLFCETYNPIAFRWAWSDEHLTIIRRIEEAIRSGGLFAFAMPRGSGKTSICRMGTLWGAAYAHVRYPFLIGATQGKAEESLDTIKRWIRFLLEFSADFPEISYPAIKLGGVAQGASGQTCEGRSTDIEWSKDRVVLPTVPPPPNLPGSESMEFAPTSGCLIGVSGLTGEGLRGSLHGLQSGELVRPDLALLDDPQTAKSAGSPSQNNVRERLISQDVLGMAGPGARMAAVMPCTVIAPDDMVDRLLDRQKHPLWRGERTQMLRSMPVNMDAWEKYFEVYRECAQLDPADFTRANEHYEQHRAKLDEGADASWADRKYDTDVSAIQHAMNIYCRDPMAFFAEYQNDPESALPDDENRLDLDEVAARGAAPDRGIVPLDCPRLVGFIDVQGRILYWLVLAVGEGFTSRVVDYGAWPDQGRQYFTLSDARRTLGDEFPGAGQEAQILQGLESLTGELLSRQWQREGGGEAGIERLLIDAAWGDSTGIVYQFVREAKSKSQIMPSIGRGIRASNAPMDAWPKQQGEEKGHNWRIRTSDKRGGVRYCLYSTNYWKTFTARRLRVSRGDSGAVTFYKESANHHRMLAEHITAERAVSVESQGRRVDEWQAIPNRDNHLFDCLVGSYVAAATIGVTMIGQQAEERREPRKFKLSELQRRKR